MYLLGGCDAEGADQLRERLDELGESVAIATSGVVGGYSVHVHTDDAGAAIEAGLALGARGIAAKSANNPINRRARRSKLRGSVFVAIKI